MADLENEELDEQPDQPVPSKGKKKPTQQDVLDQYEVEDSDFDPEIDLVSSTKKPEVAEENRDRDEQGRFKGKPKAHQHSKRVLRMAADLGLPQSQIDETEPETLDEVVYHLNRQRLQDIERSRRESSVPEPVAEEPEPEPELGLDESQYDPGLIGVVKSQARQLAELRKKLDGVQGIQQANITTSTTARCDRAFSRHDILGKGNYSDLAQDSPEMIRRRAVAELVKQNTSALSLEQKIDLAVQTLWPGQKAKAKAAPADDEAEEESDAFKKAWKNGGVARPTQRQGGPEPKGKRAAEKAVATWLREKRFMDEGLGDEESTLPD